MSLSSEEYENIWLRVKDKISMWVISYVAVVILLPISIISTIGMNALVERKLDKRVEEEVQRILSSGKFEEQISEKALTHLKDVGNEVDSIESSLENADKRIESLLNQVNGLPITYIGGRLTIASQDGKQFVLEKGVSVAGGRVTFSQPFTEPPLVFLSEYGNLEKKPMKTKVITSTVDYFDLFPLEARSLAWVAIGEAF